MAELYFKIERDWEKVVKLRSEIAKLEAQLSEMDASKSPEAIKVMENQLSTTKKEMNSLVSEAAKVGAVLNDDFSKQVFDASQNVNSLTQKLIIQKGTVKEVEHDIARLSARYKQLATGTSETSSVLSEMNTAKKVLKEEKTMLFDLAQQQSEARLLVKKLRDEYTQYKGSSKDVVSLNSKIWKSFKKVFSFSEGLAVLFKGVKDGIMTIVEFQQVNANLAAILGKSRSEIISLTQSAKALGNTTEWGASQITRLQTELVQLGFDEKQILDMQKPILKFATAINVDLADAATLAGSTLRAFEMDSNETERVVSAMAVATNRSALDFSYLNTAMSIVAPVANKFNFTIEETTALLSTLANSGFNASSAATVTHNILLNLADANGKLAQELGRPVKGLDDFTQGLILLRKKGTDLDKMLELTDERSLSAFSTFLSGAESARELAKELQNTSGELERKQKERLNTVEGSVKLLKSAWESLMLSFSSSTGIMKAVIDSLTGIVNAVNSVVSSSNNTVESYKIQIEETAKLEHEMTPLISRYEVLNKKMGENKDETKLNKDEQEELKNIINLIAGAIPGVITEFDKYGNALDINTDKAIEYLRVQKAILNFTHRDLIKSEQKKLNDLRIEMAREQSIYESGGTTITPDGGFKTVKQDLTTDELTNKYKYIKFLGKQIEEQEKLVNGLTGVTAEQEYARATFRKKNKEDLEAWIQDEENAKDEYFHIAREVLTEINNPEKGGDEKPEIYSKAYKDAEDDWKEKKAKLEKIKRERDQFTKAEYEQAVKDEATAGQKFLDLGGIVDPKKVNDTRESQAQYKLLLDKQALDRIRSEEDVQNQLTQERIDLMDEGSEKYIAQMKLNFEREKQAIDRQKEDFLRKKIDDVRAAFEANPANKDKKGAFDGSKIELTGSEQNYFVEKYNNLASKYEKIEKERIDNQEADWDDYLIRYGSFQMKKDALTRKYNKQIDDALKEGSVGKAASLQKEFEELSAALDIDKLKHEMNWELIFGDLSKVTEKQLKSIKQQLKEFKESNTFKDTATTDQIKVIEEAMASIDSALVDKGGFFGGLSDSMEEYKRTVENLQKAQEEYDKALASGNQIVIDKAKTNLNKAENEQANAAGSVEKSKDKAINNMTSVANAMSKLGSAEFNLTSFGSAVGELVDVFDQSGNAIGGLIASILAMLDQISEQGYDKFVGNIFKSIGSASRSIAETVAKPWAKLYGIKIGSSGNKAAKDAQQLQDITNKLSLTNDGINKLIERRIELIKDATAAERGHLKALTESQIKEQQKYNEYKFDQLSGNEIFGKAGKNNNLTLDALMKKEGLKDYDDFVKWWNEGGYVSLITEEGYDLRNKEMWDNIVNSNNDMVEAEERIREAINESNTGTTFDELRSSLLDLVATADTTFNDISDSFEDHMRKAILNMVRSKYITKQLEDWYEDFSAAMSDGELTQDEVTKLRSDYEDIFNVARNNYDAALNMSGISMESSSNQEATKRGFKSMSQDTADELNGRFTTLQMAGEEIKEQTMAQTMALTDIKGSLDLSHLTMDGIRTIADETRDILRDTYLLTVDIRDNTSAIIKPIKEMALDIKAVKLNTSKL